MPVATCQLDDRFFWSKQTLSQKENLSHSYSFRTPLTFSVSLVQTSTSLFWAFHMVDETAWTSLEVWARAERKAGGLQHWLAEVLGRDGATYQCQEQGAWGCLEKK